MSCGSFTMLGHGDNAICGQKYRGEELFVCASCKIKAVEEELEALRALVATSGGLKCPNCPDEGFTGEQDGHGDWYQLQCEWCYTIHDSVFRRNEESRKERGLKSMQDVYDTRAVKS